MLVAVTTTYLEMTSPDQLRPGRLPPAPIEMEQLDRASASSISSTYARIGTPYHWTQAMWSEAQWDEWLSRPDLEVWIARVGNEIAGLVVLEIQGNDVEISVFGLVPDYVGRGFGGLLLTLATRLAWDAKRADRTPTKRVWLHTSSLDHPHAKPNYERRGFRAFRTEHKRRDIA